MQQGSAGPNPVKLRIKIEILKTQDPLRLPDQFRTHLRQHRRGIKGGHPVAMMRKLEAVPAGTAAGIQDPPALRNQA